MAKCFSAFCEPARADSRCCGRGCVSLGDERREELLVGGLEVGGDEVAVLGANDLRARV